MNSDDVTSFSVPTLMTQQQSQEPGSQLSLSGDASSRYRHTAHSSLSSFVTATMTAATPTAVPSATTTITITAAENAEAENNHVPEMLTLTLRPRPSVRWDENVIDNEGMSRKSSKRCCIFHKQRDFGESSTDSSDDGDDDSGDRGSDDEQGAGFAGSKSSSRKVARPKKNSVPDFQRFHA